MIYATNEAPPRRWRDGFLEQNTERPGILPRPERSGFWPRTYRGLTLLELLITVGILSSGIIIIIQTICFSGKAAGLSRDLTAAVFLAQDKLQEVEFKENISALGEMPKEYKEKAGNYEWEYSLKADNVLRLYRLDFNVRWHSQKRIEGINISTLLRNESP